MKNIYACGGDGGVSLRHRHLVTDTGISDSPVVEIEVPYEVYNESVYS